MTEPVAKGWMRIAFERAMRLKEHECDMAGGHYTNQRTHDLWTSFKAGIVANPGRGTFVVAEIRNSQPYFPDSERTQEFRDNAKEAMRKRADRTGAICAVFQQIGAYDPRPKLPKN